MFQVDDLQSSWREKCTLVAEFINPAQLSSAKHQWMGVASRSQQCMPYELLLCTVQGIVACSSLLVIFSPNCFNPLLASYLFIPCQVFCFCFCFNKSLFDFVTRSSFGDGDETMLNQKAERISRRMKKFRFFFFFFRRNIHSLSLSNFWCRQLNIILRALFLWQTISSARCCNLVP